MNSTDLQMPDDATLVAWLDGELPTATTAAITKALRQDAALQHRVHLLQAARAEFAWALQRPDSAPPSSPQQHRGRLALRGIGSVLIAAAALVVLVVLSRMPQASKDEAASNAWLDWQVSMPSPAWDLFSCIRFHLTGTCKTTTPCQIVARQANETDEQLADRIFADKANPATLPLVLEAEVTGPDGWPRRGRVARVEGTFTQATSQLTVELVDVQIDHPTISPIVTVALDADGVREDFWWGLRRVGAVQIGGAHGCMPEQVGGYRVRFTLRSFTGPLDSRFLTFAEPLSVATGFAVRGVVGEWSAPVDGMRARIVTNTEQATSKRPLVFALQLRNESDRARRCNLTGTTIAKIPQPFHLDLMVDGEPWQQRTRLGVVTDANSSDLSHRVGWERSLVALADYWRQGATMPSQLTGVHRIGVRFHSEASVWLGSDKELWQGKIDTPPVEVTFAR